ncbi:MAG: hypothetical protein EOP04_00465 [Proteobacteria bacterium]|nr:MAG: hypothetical protein EOP04_00465 [Pseudomonadota bacterium]
MSNVGGVYIWGYVFETVNEVLVGCPIPNDVQFNSSIHMFIPVYVGKGGESILSCFEGRHNNSRKNDNYIILSNNYLKEFFCDSNFPEHLGTGANNSHEWFEGKEKYFKDKIHFYNNYHLLKGIYELDCNRFTPKESYSVDELIQVLKQNGKGDEAQALYTSKYSNNDNRYFCYASIASLPDDVSYTDLEAYIFYLLKGKTVSQHTGLNTLVKHLRGRTVAVKCSEESLRDRLFKEEISNEFNGYLKKHLKTKLTSYDLH